MKLLIITTITLLSCSNSMAQSKSTTPRQLQEGVYLKEGGGIAKDYTRCQLVGVKRNLQGFKHLFVADNGDSLYRTFQRRLIVDSCYQVYNVKK